ncbi:hypothetical protein [Streptosporangium sp. KLBMP 9127]
MLALLARLPVVGWVGGGSAFLREAASAWVWFVSMLALLARLPVIGSVGGGSALSRAAMSPPVRLRGSE